MNDPIKFFIKEVGKEVIKLTCAGTVNILKYIPGVHIYSVEDDPLSLAYVPDHFKAERMCKRVVKHEPETLEYVPDDFKSKRICEWDVKDESEILENKINRTFLCLMTGYKKIFGLKEIQIKMACHLPLMQWNYAL